MLGRRIAAIKRRSLLPLDRYVTTTRVSFPASVPSKTFSTRFYERRASAAATPTAIIVSAATAAATTIISTASASARRTSPTANRLASGAANSYVAGPSVLSVRRRTATALPTQATVRLRTTSSPISSAIAISILAPFTRTRSALTTSALRVTTQVTACTASPARNNNPIG